MNSLDESLVKTTKGAGIALVGSVVGMLLVFVNRFLIARYGTEAWYGVFSLAFVILNICVIIATLGLDLGITRSLAYARGENKTKKVQELISTSIQLGLLASISLGIIVFFTSDIIATKIFHDTTLSLPLKIFALGIPFFTMISVLVALFRGFDNVKPTAYFLNILMNLLFALALLPVVFLRLPFEGVFYALLASLVITCTTIIVYATKRLPYPIRFTTKAFVNPVTKELLAFSLPLFGVAMFHMIVAWTDTLMLGYFKTAEEVGLYNAAYPLAHIIIAPVSAMVMIYLPIISGLYSKNQVPEIRRTYTILTKWVFTIGASIFIVLFLFPESVLNFLFGANYTPASQALRILSLGFLTVSLLGLNSAILTGMGKTRFLLWASVAAAGVNVILCIVLIPPLGIVGTSIATAASFAFHYIIKYVKVRSLLKVNPLSKNLLKPAIISVGPILIIYIIVKNFLTVTFWMLPLLFILFCAIYFLAFLFSKSFDREDIMMLLAIEKRVGMNLAPIKKILGRFL